MKPRSERSCLWSFVSVLAAMTLVLAACGGEGGTDTTSSPGTTGQGGTEGPSETVSLDVLFPVNSPILHGYRVAQEAGYYAEEGLEVNMQFLGGGAEVSAQLIAGNADVGIIPVGNVVTALEEGQTDLRAIWNQVYGSIFYIATPAGSGIESAEDLAGKKIGISDLSGGEVPIVRGIVDSVGLTEEDVELIPIGEGTALAVNAIETGQVDAVGGSVNDIIALEVQGLDLTYIIPDALLQLPASGAVVRQETLDNKGDAVAGFLRASTKGFYWAQVNPEASLAVLKKVTPEQFTDETGDLIFEAVVALTWAPEGTSMGFQSPDTWGAFFDFVGAERPDVDLSVVVTDELIDEANDFDPAAVEEDANNYTP